MLLAITSLILLTLAASPHALALKWAWDGVVNPGGPFARALVGVPNLLIILTLIMMAFFAMAVEVEAYNNPVPEKKAAKDDGLTGSSASVANYVNAARSVGGRLVGA